MTKIEEQLINLKTAYNFWLDGLYSNEGYIKSVNSILGEE